MHNIIQAIESRSSTNHFDTTRQISEADIAQLVRLSTCAPSAYNFQNWKFIAVRSANAKARLVAVSFGQQKIAEASVTFIICGTLAAHEQLPRVLKPSVDDGILPYSVFEEWIAMAAHTHIGNPQLQRDEAIRSASLAAMTLMLAAQGMGLATCAMSGFDAIALAQEFHLAVTEVPVILVTVGYSTPGNRPQKPRRPMNEVITFA
ncbi:MAG: nitroreductase family protein [Rhodospirillaceae bacterium]|nr:nitroreductase family protein [Rhodospirillales bacterium]